MKRVLCIILAILTTLCMFACQEEIEYTIYSSGTNSASDTSVAEKVTFKSSSGLETYLGSISDEVNESLDKTKLFQIDGKKYELEYRVTAHTDAALCNNETIVDNYSEYEFYYTTNISSEINSIILKYHRDTDRIMDLVITGDVREKGGTFTEKQAKDKSRKVLHEMYAEYCEEIEEEYAISAWSSDTEVTVMYSKNIAGYDTTDRIVLSFNLAGELIGINATMLGIFAPIEDEITKGRIEKAKEVLLDSISDKWTITGEELIMDVVTAVCYLRISVGNKGSAAQYCINVF